MFPFTVTNLNVGHDFLDRSCAKGAYMIWTHDLKNLTYEETFSHVNSSERKAWFALKSYRFELIVVTYLIQL